MPGLQENGQFIGEQRYQQLLRVQQPPMTPADFEDNIRNGLTVDKLRASLTDWVTVTDKELEQEYRRRNDKVKLAVVAFTADTFRAQVTATDAEVASYFEAHKADFKIPEKRKIRYLLIDVEALRAKVTVAPADVERAYTANQRAVLDAGADPREPHPVQDRGQGRRGGEGQGRRRAEAGEGAAPISPRSRRSIRRTKGPPSRAAISTTSARARWCRSSTRPRSRCSPDRSAIS